MIDRRRPLLLRCSGCGVEVRAGDFARHAEIEQIVLDLVAASDGGADTYEVREIVERGRLVLGLEQPSWRRSDES